MVRDHLRDIIVYLQFIAVAGGQLNHIKYPDPVIRRRSNAFSALGHDARGVRRLTPHLVGPSVARNSRERK